MPPEMTQIMHCLERFNQKTALDINDLSILSHGEAPSLMKAALMARLLHRDQSRIEQDLFRRLCADLPDVHAILAYVFPQNTRALDSAVPQTLDPFIARVFREEWDSSKMRQGDFQLFMARFLSGEVSPELVAAWLGTIVERGLSTESLYDLTHAMRDSGQIYDYRMSPKLQGRKLLRRYPTGGLSEKTALILPGVLAKASEQYPIASNFLVARTLGFTGGTWDKLSAIPTFRFPLPGGESEDVMATCGVAMTITHGDLNPADRKLYQMRSVTGTIESFELIVSSIASKQLAVPAHHLLLDVRYGDGAFLRSLDEAKRCAAALVALIDEGGTPCSAHLTNTPQPNGSAIGNALEVAEAIAVMGGRSSARWDSRALEEQRELVLLFYGLLMSKAFDSSDVEPWIVEARGWFHSGDILRGFSKLLSAHHVSSAVIEKLFQDPNEVLAIPNRGQPVLAHQSGRLIAIDQRRLGHLVNFGMGAGGNDYQGILCVKSGIKLGVRLGDIVQCGQPLCWVFDNASDTLNDSTATIEQCFRIGK